MAQGEGYNLEWESRNNVVTFRDPKTAEKKGEYFGFCAVFLAVFIFCLPCNSLGRATTQNDNDINSIICFNTKKSYI